jgi:serpin B
MTATPGRAPYRSIAATACAATLFVLAGCGGSSSGGEGTATVPGSAVLVGKAQPVKQGSLSASDVAAADTAFGFDLFRKLCLASPQDNLVVSPASAAQALGMVDAGAGGDTQKAVAKLLHVPAWGPDLVAARHAQAAALGQVDQIKVSNHVFEQKGLKPTQQTLNDLKTAYDADLRQLDFADEPGSTDAINKVISNDTAGLIPKLFDGPLDAATRSVLANAILLDAKWTQPFTDSNPGTFHAADRHDVTAPMMDNTDGSFASRTAGGWQSVVLPYEGGKLEAVAMLPDLAGVGNSGAGGGADAQPCATPSTDDMTALTSGTSTNAGVVLPKLDLSQTLPLTQTLADMGLPLTGDYNGLGEGINQISEVIQKVVMKVDEKGTKAAAATGVVMTESARVGPPSVVTFDRPFLLVLEDTATHTPLFVARVANPTP